MKQPLAIIGISIAAVVLLTLIISAVVGVRAPSIGSYEECVYYGYPVQESYPARCVMPDGRSFTQPVNSIPSF